jgi:hypothetical protein
VEACVGGWGWRRLLRFNASEKNVGSGGRFAVYRGAVFTADATAEVSCAVE